MLKSSGIPTRADLEQVYPAVERLEQGPVAIIECFQKIPCNPCATVCPRGAILPFVDINDRPNLNAERCNGCALCVANCPGLAIFVLDMTYGATEALLKLPYEFLPLPPVGATVAALDRGGEVIGKGTVMRVQNPPSFDRTAIIHLAVAKEIAHEVRNIKVEGEDADTIVCRCEDLTLTQLRQLIGAGYTTFDEIKRISRAGMGPCQGRTCRALIEREIAALTGTPIREQAPAKYRQPSKPVTFSAILGGEDHEKDS